MNCQTPIKNCFILIDNRLLDAINNITYIIIRHIRTSWQTETNLKDFFRHTTHVCHSISVYRLLMHRLPHRATFNLLREHEHAKSLHIGVRLTIRNSRIYLFFNDTATTEIYTLSLHDALPIFSPDLGYKCPHQE